MLPLEARLALLLLLPERLIPPELALLCETEEELRWLLCDTEEDEEL